MKLSLIVVTGAISVLLVGCQINGRDFAEIESEAAAQPVKVSVPLEPLGAERIPPARDKLVGMWECHFQTDILDFRPTKPSPVSSVLHYRDVMTFKEDGVYFEQMYRDGKQTVNTDGLWRYENGVLTLVINGDTRREYSTIWRGDDVWERRMYPETAAIDWWRAFYERKNPGYVCSTSGGYQADGCLRILGKFRHVGGSGYIVNAIDTPRVYRKITKEVK